MPVTEFDAALARSAEATLARVRAAREAIGAVIFGQDKVVEQTLATLLSGGHGLLIGVPGLAKTKLVETLGDRARARRAAHAVHARPDADRHPRLGSDGGGAGRPALLPLPAAARSSRNC